MFSRLDAIEVDLALHRPQFTDDSLQQRRLAGRRLVRRPPAGYPWQFPFGWWNRRVAVVAEREVVEPMMADVTDFRKRQVAAHQRIASAPTAW